MKTSLRLAGAFIGLIVGVGFASGQEVLQFYASHGRYGFLAAIAAAGMFSFMTMVLFQIGSQLQTKSHKEAIEYICGPRLGKVVDVILTVFLFCVILMMLAGAGASFKQQLGLPNITGSLTIAVATVITVCLGLRKVITLMSWITPVLIPILIALAIYAVNTTNLSVEQIESLAAAQPRAVDNWLLSALLYVSSNIAGTAPVLIIMGGSVLQTKCARNGGLIGGMLMGAMLMVMVVVLLAKINVIGGSPIPTLALITEASPVLGNIMLGMLMIKLYATVSGLSYALTARLQVYGMKKQLAAVLSVGTPLLFTSIGFISLVGTLLTFMGYVGLLLMGCIVLTWYKSFVTKAPIAQKAVS
ncbi:hypothetical protein SB759_07265 [Pseudomonas sp. SIMBA_059]|uniref:YkvI family membrane protein n=1 Tax=Pseudomonas palleroniana TaxID=191390 RepID=UPI0018E6725A|nr:hypothetical protein [Pseudomonas palleroniana]MBI6906800.1 hypothetical protein [Pseudomonas palleroniana]